MSGKQSKKNKPPDRKKETAMKEIFESLGNLGEFFVGLGALYVMIDAIGRKRKKKKRKKKR